MKKILFGFMVLSALVPLLQAQANTINIGAPNAWAPKVGDDAIYTFYEEQPNSDGVFTGTLERKVTAVTSSNITVQIILTKQDYENNPPVVTTQTVNEMMLDIQDNAIEMQDCNLGGDSSIPLSLTTDAGVYSSCLVRPMLGKDFDGDAAAVNIFIANVPFGEVREDTIKTGNGNHIRITLKQITLGQ